MQLPYSGFNTNFLCALDSLFLTVMRAVVYDLRIAGDFVEAAIIDLLGCLQNAAGCSFGALKNTLGASVSALTTSTMCDTEEVVVKFAGVVVAMLSPAFEEIYANSGHPTVKGGFSLGDDSSYLLTAHHSCAEYENASGGCGPFAAGDPRLALCTSVRNHCVSTCTQHINHDQCVGDGSCTWVNVRCYTKDDQWMTYQVGGVPPPRPPLLVS